MRDRNLGKTLALSVAAALAIPILCAAAFVQFQQHLLRWRAERLLADIHSILPKNASQAISDISLGIEDRHDNGHMMQRTGCG